MEYANKIKSPAVILYGENEIKTGKPTLRNLASGDEKSITIKEIVIPTIFRTESPRYKESEIAERQESSCCICALINSLEFVLE